MIKSVLLSHVYMYVFLISISKLSLALQVIKYRMMSFIYFIAVEYYMSQIVDSETRFLGKPLLLQFFSRLRENIFALKSPMSRVLSNSFKYIRKGVSFWVPKRGGALPPKFMLGGLRTPLPPLLCRLCGFFFPMLCGPGASLRPFYEFYWERFFRSIMLSNEDKFCENKTTYAGQNRWEEQQTGR